MAREMKDSGVEWIGEIPKEWEVVKLKSYFSFEKGKNASMYTQEFIGQNIGEFPVYSGQTENDGVMGKINRYDYDIEECLFTTTVGAKVMTPKVLRGKFNLSQNCLIMKKEKECSIKFFYYILLPLFSYEKSLIPNYMQPSLRMEDLRRYKFYIPPLEEQEKIANYLDKKVSDIDLIIEKTRTTIEDYKKYKHSIITEAVTKGVNPNVEMKDSGVEWIGEIPKEWEIDRLKNNFLLKKGLSITKENLKEYGVPVINYGQIHSKDNNGIEITKNLIRYVDESYLEENLESLVEEGDFIFADTSEDLEGSGNNIYISNVEKLFAGYHTIILKSKIQKENKYLAYLFKTNCWRSQIRSRVTGIKLFSITQKILKEMTILLPPLEEQNQIAEYLDKKTFEIDTLITKKEALIAELEEYKKSLIYECVTGKKEIK